MDQISTTNHENQNTFHRAKPKRRKEMITNKENEAKHIFQSLRFLLI